MKYFSLILLVFFQNIFSAPLSVGSDWDLKNFTDQRENPVLITEDTTTILFVSDMDASKVVHQVLEMETQDSLSKKNLVFISDIHKMPSLITRFIALPKMRSYQYPMALIQKEGISKDIPREKGKVTVFFLKKGKITEIQYSPDSDSLRKTLETTTKK